MKKHVLVIGAEKFSSIVDIEIELHVSSLEMGHGACVISATEDRSEAISM